VLTTVETIPQFLHCDLHITNTLIHCTLGSGWSSVGITLHKQHYYSMLSCQRLTTDKSNHTCPSCVCTCTYALNSDYQWHHKVCTGHLPISMILYPHGGQLGCATEPELPGW